MFAGHFGLAAACKSKSSSVPLWALMLGTQLLDVVFVPLYLAGVETIVPVGDGGYGANVIHADYTHSLVGALLLALLAGLLGRRLWGQRGGLVIAALVFSHWVLDLLVHRHDLPLLPGNWGDLPLLGFGIWATPLASLVLESLLLVIGFALYFRSVTTGTNGTQRRLAFLSSGVLGLLLVLALLSDVLGLG